ncbi:MAG TPA: hypothetical protein VK502_01120 [Candidatus Saccharimonadales bacterium]|nr:hypothetical protein [Candidatus Saccharimonadales bacterium]
MNNNVNISKVALEAFPILSGATFIRQLASPVPLVPDTTFDIFTTDSRAFLALVTTDYADPQDQSIELKNISGQYAFEFVDLLKPHNKNNEVTEILAHDDIEGDFLVYEPYKNHRRCYYLVNLKTQSE